ncbi:MAG: hypothetical protein LQ345_002577 [Seirophora villosa]|nr:MAG: hypothetical protein LQ345_002577 [Seirophora villosa]
MASSPPTTAPLPPQQQQQPPYPPLSPPPSSINPSVIDTSSHEDARVSFRTTSLDATIPVLRARFPFVDPLYLTKIFRGTIGAIGLIWLDAGRQDASPLDFSDLPHLLYCFEVYGQIVCVLARPQGVQRELELQEALAEFRLRLLKMSKWAGFESLVAWFKAFVEGRLREGQDDPEGWRERREDLEQMLRRRM